MSKPLDPAHVAWSRRQFDILREGGGWGVPRSGLIFTFDAAKRDLEDRDRTRMLAADARALLNKFDGWQDWEPEAVMDELLAIMSWGDARRSLEYIDWEDKEQNR